MALFLSQCEPDLQIVLFHTSNSAVNTNPFLLLLINRSIAPNQAYCTPLGGLLAP